MGLEVSAGSGQWGWGWRGRLGLGRVGRGLAEHVPALTFAVAGGARVGSCRLWPHHEEA